MTKIGKIRIDNFSGGWSNGFAKASTISSPSSKPNSYYSGLFNINKSNYLGQLAEPIGNNPNKESVDSLTMNAAKTSDNFAHFFCTTGVLAEMNVATSWAPGHTNWAAPAGCLTDEYKDIWTHVYTTGAECVFYTYQTAGNAYVGYKFPQTATGRNDTYYALANRNVPHVGCVSVNNRSYVTDKNLVRAYDPAVGGFPTSINVGVGYTCNSIVDYGNYVAIVGNNGSNSRMWLWDGSAEFPNFQFEIRDTNVTAITNEGGSLRVFTYGKNNTTKIKTFNGSGFSEEADWEVPTSLCASPLHGMVDIWLNQIVWRTPDGYIWTYGSPRKTEIDTGANRIGIMETNTSSNGCVKNLYQDRLFVGITNLGVSYVYEVLGTNPYSSSTGAFQYKSNLYELPHKSTIKCIHLFFSIFDYVNAGASSATTINLYSGYETTDLLNFTMPANPYVGGSYRHTYYPVRQEIPNLDSFYLIVNHSAGANVPFVLKKIEVEYAYDDQMI